MKSVIVLSGGMDSTTLLYKLKDEWKEVFAISFNYGQKHIIELDKASKTCERLWVDHKIIDLSCITELISNSSLTSDIEVPEWHYEDENMKNTVVPNRNSIMANIAIWYAVNIWAKEVALWVHSWDHAIYPDCRPEFIDALRNLAKIANYESVEIYTPYLDTDKWWIVKDWLRLEVDYSLTHTCYKWKTRACGKCWSCQERLEAFKINWVEDPILYKNTDISKDTLDLIEKCVILVENNESSFMSNHQINTMKDKLEQKNIEWYKKYWEFKFENNNMYQMIEEEILDAINYSCYELIKLEKIEWIDCDQVEDVESLLSDLIDIYANIQEISINNTEKLEKHFNS